MNKQATDIVAYITIIGWIIAIIAGDRQASRFHLNQALVIWIFGIIAGILRMIPFIRWIGLILAIIVFILWIIGLIRACMGSEKPVPILGGINILS